MQARSDSPRILAVQTAFLGDVVLTTPLLRAIRARFPGSHLAFMGTPAGVGVLEGLEAVDEFISYDKRGAEKGLSGMVAKARQLKSRGFEIAVCAHRSARTAILLAMSGIRTRIGFANGAMPWLYQRTVPRDPGLHEVERNLGLMEVLDWTPDGFDARLELSDLPPAGEDLLGDGSDGPRVGICPGSVWPTKRWRADGFAEVADRLADSRGARVYLIGSEADRVAAAEVERSSKSAVVNLAGRTGLRDWLRVIRAMDLVITNDSAPTHIACAFGKPTVVIYGPTTSRQGFAPWSDNSRVVEAGGLGCRPCGEHGAKRCPEGHFKCMDRVDAGRVLESAVELLEGR